MTQPTRRILHVDMDAFFASVEIRENPQLHGKPVIVGGAAERRGVVAAASYAARRFGVRSAMPMATALRLCPQAVRINGRIDLYAEVSQQIREIFSRYTPEIEPLSLDEAFLDVTASERLFGDAESIAQAIKTAIYDELALVASVGVAPCKFVAKIASDVQKPDGFVVVEDNAVQAFLDPLPVSRLWGAGKVTVAVFERMGIRTIAQLRRQSETWLQSRFGKFGQHLWLLAHGIDARPVISDSKAKTISHETTFATDIADESVLEAWLMQLTEQVCARLRRHDLKGRTVTLKLRYPDFKTVTRSQSMALASDSTDHIWRVARELLQRNYDKRQALRLIGIGVANFTARHEDIGVRQQDLFVEDSQDHSKIDDLTDDINSRFGPQALQRGRTRQRHKVNEDKNG